MCALMFMRKPTPEREREEEVEEGHKRVGESSQFISKLMPPNDEPSLTSSGAIVPFLPLCSFLDLYTGFCFSFLIF